MHKWRAEEQAILVGPNTVLQDNPSLTVRDWMGTNPIRVVLDKNEKLANHFNVFNDEAETIILKENSAKSICTKLFNKNISSIIIEGGAKTLQMFIDENLWDEARVFTGKAVFGSGVKSPGLSGKLISEQIILDDILKFYTND